MRGERIDLRVTLKEKLSWHCAAQVENMKLAEWISAQCNKSLGNYKTFQFYPAPKTCQHGTVTGEFCGLCCGPAEYDVVYRP